MNQIKFTRPELEEMGLPWEAIHDEQYDNGRWESFHQCIFAHEGRHWSVNYTLPLTEMQEDSSMYPWPEDDEIVATEVREVEVVTTRWEPVE